jgi:hypothetical protein
VGESATRQTLKFGEAACVERFKLCNEEVYRKDESIGKCFRLCKSTTRTTQTMAGRLHVRREARLCYIS